MKKVYVPELVIIDFDRTLGDIDAALARFYDAAESVGVNTENIQSARKSVEQDGGSFDPLTFLTTTLASDKLEQFYKLFKSADEPKIMFEDGERFLKKLQDLSISYFVLTYGVNRDWQGLKLKASGYQGGYKIIEHSDKGNEMKSWKNEQGEYEVIDERNEVTYFAKSLCLIDDKISAFEFLPEDCTGFLIQRSDVLLPSQQGQLSEQVLTIKSFDQLEVIQDHIERISLS